ncbi:MAG: T9SS type A sorting domain-containing protein [Ignavibacteria bacterium]|nr:T9SS type A sorting domain-containing protein [Ignavibacteria bacterium]MBL0109041.1 T9SS type A sorting domain-containing protein [Ignavibacteria bacterium]
MPTLITDTIIYVTGATYPADTNWIPVTSEKIFTVQITGNIDSLRWSNNTIQRTKLFAYQEYTEITDSTYHIIDRITSVKLNESELPSSYSLSQNYPNPFNPSTIISYALTNDGYASIIVYNALGEEIITLVNEIKKAGYYSVKFEATGLAAGVYFYRIESANYVSVKKMILLK